MKKYLLDTHLLLWAVMDSKKLSQKAKEIISDNNHVKFFSVISIWETAIKHMKNPDKIDNISPKVLISFCEEAGFEELTLSREHVLHLATLTRSDDAPPHKDPFDRMLIAQAKSENMIFLTHDDLLPHYNEPCIMLV